MAAAKGAGILALIGGAPKGMGADSEAGEPSGEEQAIRDFFEAGKAGDYAGATEAFRRAYAECERSGEPEGDEGMPTEAA